MRANFRYLIIVLACLPHAYLTPAQPMVGVAPTNTQILLSWPAIPSNYVLQSTTNFVSTNWVFVTDAIPTIDSPQNAVTISNNSQVRFFRLIQLPTITADGMAFVPAGTFTIGDTLDGTATTNIYVSAFYIDTNLVSLSQWQTVYNWATNNGYTFTNSGLGKALSHPVQTVDWFDCVKWCNARSQYAGLTPVYYTDAGLTQVYQTGLVTNPYVQWSANGYRLPTEAEWEKAARGGVNGQRFPWGNTISESQANYDGNTSSYSYDLGPNGYNENYDVGARPYTSPVGSFAPNGYGLFDMGGNVWEWCWDWYAGSPYPTGSPYLGGINPRGPTTGTYRVFRGGSWEQPPSDPRCSQRGFYNGGGVIKGPDNGLGFRSVRGL